MLSTPNSVIGKGWVINHSEPNATHRIQTHVGVAYGTDLEYARGAMVAALREKPWVLKNQPVEALFLEFGDSSLNFRVRCWVDSFAEKRRLQDRLNTTLYHALNKADVEIPFPQRDLHLVSSRVSLGAGNGQKRHQTGDA